MDVGRDCNCTIEDTITSLIEFFVPPEERERRADHLKGTPERFAQAWKHWTSGYRVHPRELIKCFGLETTDRDVMVFQANIPVWSLCAHHLAPFWGLAHIAYIPEGKIVGLSKLARVVDAYARRLQTQEQLTCQVADLLYLPDGLDARGVGVVLQCRHSCMESRGVEKAGTLTVTSALRGDMKDEPECRAEFMSLVNVAVAGAKGV